MSELLKNLYNTAEQIKGRSLVILLSSVFFVFIFIGFAINYAIQVELKNPEMGEEVSQDTKQNQNPAASTLDGIITYVDPRTYPGEDISYYLSDSTGKEIILLKANDDKLQVSEGLFVTIQGKKMKMSGNGKEYILVEKITLNNK